MNQRTRLALALLIVAASLPAAAPGNGAEVIHKVGAVTWHAKTYAGQALALAGFLLKAEAGYVLFSDEPDGPISAHDLPVSGAGITAMRPGVKYVIHGTFVRGGLKASNGNVYHFELSAPPAAG